MRRDLSSWLGTLGMTSRKATYRRSRTNHTLKSRGAAHAISLSGGEPLDPRKMLAVTTNFNAISGQLDINLTADNDIAGLVLNTTGLGEYEVYDKFALVSSFLASVVNSISVIDSKGGLGSNQTFEIRDGGAIAASLSVTQQVETTKFADDVKVTSAATFGGFGIAVNSPTIEFNDASLGDPLYLSTDKTNIGLGKTGGNGILVIGGTDVDISTGAGAGNIDFLDDILGEDGSGTLTLAAGTGVITFAGDIGGTGVGEDLHGVLISSAASASATGKFYLADALGDGFTDGLTIGDGVNNVNFSNGGEITGFGEDGAGIFFDGSSTNSTISNFLLTGNTYGIYAGNYYSSGLTSDLSGTVIDDNVIGEDDIGIYLDSVAGNLNGEDVLLIGGTVGNLIAANGEDGIYGFASTGVEIRNNTIVANGLDGLGAGSGIYLEGGGEYLITENTIGEDGVGLFLGQGNSYDGITIDGEDGFYSYAGTEIRANDIEFNASYGVRVQGVTLDTGEDSILIFDNLIARNGANPTRASAGVGGIRIDGSENIRIINNDISFNGEDAAGNGIDIVNGSHGTAVFSNNIVTNANHGIYVVDSSTAANPVLIGDVLPIASVTATTVTIEGDARAAILPGQQIGLAYVVDPTNVVATSYLITRTVLSVSYDDVEDVTTLTFSNVPGAPNPYALTLGNYILGNGEDSLAGSGISVLATGEGAPSTGAVEGIEILGNVIVGNQADGIHLESTRAADIGDLSDALIAGNFVGRDPVGEDSPNDFGNRDDGIEVINGDGITIQANYVADNGRPNPSVGGDNNGVEIIGSLNVDIGEDGLGNYIVRNADDGVDIQSSLFVTVVDNEIAFSGDDGICIADGSAEILIEANWIHDNAARGVDASDTLNVTITGNLVQNNGEDGILFANSLDALVSFNIVAGNDGDGVSFLSTSGVIEGNEIYDNIGDGVYIYGGSSPFSPFGEDHFEVLGNIIRNNGDDGVDVRDGSFFGVDRDGESGPSRIAGNTIELNDVNGVALIEVNGVLVGGEFPSDINFINLNGNAGVYATGYANADVIGNEIDSNGNYGVEINNGEDLFVGGPSVEAVNTIRRNGKAGVYAFGETYNSQVSNNEISENPIGVMITSALGLRVGGLRSDFPGEEDFGNHIFDNGEGVRATGDSYGTSVVGNLIEDNLTGATLASVRGLTFGYGEAPVPTGTRALPEFGIGNIVQFNNEGLRGSGDLTDTYVGGNEFLDNTKVGIALQSAKNLTVGGFGEDSPNFISGSPVGLSASGTMTDTLVAFNEFSENTIGISLSKATGMTVGGNTIDQSAKYGISVTGNSADTQIAENTITNTGDGPYAGIGIYLSNARNVYVGRRNSVDGSSLAGLYATGNTSGTVVQGNLFTDNRIGMFLENAKNAVFGGLGEDEGNTIVGGGDPLLGEFRDGILVVGGAPGSSITGTDITDASTGVWLRDSQDIEITDTFVTGSSFYGFNASGNLTGSSFHNNFITDTVGIGGGLGHAMHLEGAQNLQVYDNLGEDSFGSGLYVTGDTTGTTVTNNLLDGNRVGISLVNATNAVIGGLGEDEGNVVIGGSDAANAVYRDGIHVIGTSTGSSIKGTDVSDVTTGLTLENATGVQVDRNTITGAEFLGVNASGTLTGSKLENNNVTGSGGLGALGHGIYLANAAGLAITGNIVEDNTGGGLYATGTTTGTTVYDNVFDGNRVGIQLVNATNAVIGGSVLGEDNVIVGGGDASNADFRDGIVASGTLTGSSITQTSITNAATGITLSAASGLFITSATVTGSQVWGLNASGECVSAVVSSTFTLTTGGAGGGAGVLLSAVQSFLIQSATISDNVIGLLATGNCTATRVLFTTWSGNTTGVINTSTGAPPLEIDPLPPAT
jgi:parallel beta-helix repeat protein